MEERIAVMLTKEEITFIVGILEAYAVTNKDVLKESVLDEIMIHSTFLEDYLNID